MNSTEVLKRVRANLNCQTALKRELDLKIEEQHQLEEAIANLQDSLNSSIGEFAELQMKLKNLSVDSLMEYSQNIRPVYAKKDDKVVYGLGLMFMGKLYNITNAEYSCVEKMNANSKQIILSIVEQVYEDFNEKGNVIFDEAGISALSEILESYNRRKSTVTKSMESVVLKHKLDRLETDLQSLQNEYDEKKKELSEVEEKLLKCKEFKSGLMQKVFSQKQKLAEKHDRLVAECGKLALKINSITDKLEDRQTLKDTAQKEVKQNIDSLVCLFDWMNNLGRQKEDLERDRQINICEKEHRISLLEESLSDVKTDVVELKGSLNLNKKINNEVVENALRNQRFLDEYVGLDKQSLPNEFKKACEFIEKKYCYFISNSVNKFVQ